MSSGCGQCRMRVKPPMALAGLAALTLRYVLYATCTQWVLYAEDVVCRGCCMQRVLYAEGAVCRGCCMQRVLYAEGAVCRLRAVQDAGEAAHGTVWVGSLDCQVCVVRHLHVEGVSSGHRGRSLQ